MFGESGYANASMGEIARRTGLAVGGVYLHFQSKLSIQAPASPGAHGRTAGRLKPDKLVAEFRRRCEERNSRAIIGSFLTRSSLLGCIPSLEGSGALGPGLSGQTAGDQRWTTERLSLLFRQLQQIPGARPRIDVQGLAIVMDSLFWSLLSEAATLSKTQLKHRIDSATHIIHHVCFLTALRGASDK